MFIKITSIRIINLQHNLIIKYHKDNKIADNPKLDFFGAVEDNLICSFKLWHLEDDARMMDVPDSKIADLKRKIDKENQKRNDFIEKMDDILLSILPQLTQDENKSLPMNSETPGSIIDRLCIGNLKIFHMKEEIIRKNVSDRHIRNCKMKLNTLKLQRINLANAFDQLMGDLFCKKKQLQVYRQFKMYNDPDLNPSLYENKN